MRSGPRCQSRNVIKNDTSTMGKPNLPAKTVNDSSWEARNNVDYQSRQKALVDRWLLERVSLGGIVRGTGVSARWLQY